MDFDEVVEFFIRDVYPSIIAQERDQHPDWPLRRMTWNNFIDGLEKSGQISHEDAYSWGQPDFIRGQREEHS